MEDEELRNEIIGLVQNIKSIKLLEYIYNFIKIAVTTWK